MGRACSQSGLLLRARAPARILRSRRFWPSSMAAGIVRSAFPRLTDPRLRVEEPNSYGESNAMSDGAVQIASPVGLIAAGGAMPFAVADAMVARGITPVFF